jgi:hypothetical protein
MGKFSHQMRDYCKDLKLEIDVKPFREYFENVEYQPIWEQFKLSYHPDHETATAEYCWIILFLGMLKLKDDYVNEELDEEWTKIMNRLLAEEDKNDHKFTNVGPDEELNTITQKVYEEILFHYKNIIYK